VNGYRVSLSKPQEGGERHLVLVVPTADEPSVRMVIREHILPPGKTIVRRYRGTNSLFLFNLDYLDRVLLAFADADMSTGLRRRMSRAEARALDALDDSEVEVPGFEGELYRFQRQGVNACLSHLDTNRVFMLNDEMGLGKTIQALAVMLKTKRKQALVVTTKGGCDAWAKIMRTKFPRVKYQIIDGDAAARAVSASTKVRVRLVNFEALRAKAFTSSGAVWGKGMVESRVNRKVWKPVNPDIFNQRYDMIITDEFHKVKNPDAQQTHGWLQLPRAEMELGMSGTPFLNNPLELFPVLHRYWPSIFTSYDVYEKNMVVKDGRKIVAYNPDYMLRLRAHLMSNSLRRRKEHVGIQMPEVIYTTVLVPMTAEQRRLYKRIANEMKVELDDGRIKSIVGALPQITRLQQACFSPELYGGSSTSGKLTELRTIIEQLVASGEKAIILTKHEPGCHIMAREFADYNPALVTGKVTGNTKINGVRISRRQVQQDKFNEDDTCKLYIGTIKANQEAISLTAGTYVIMLDDEWSPGANDQAIARGAGGGLRGIDAKGPVNVIRLQCEDSIEQWVDGVVVEGKRVIFNRTIESDGGRQRDTRKATLADLRRALGA